LRAQLTQAEAARNTAEQLRMTREKELKGAEQLDAAEREKALLSDKIRASQERSTHLETEKKRRL
jgi:hypothetical protein